MTEIFGATIPFASYCGVEPLQAADGETRLQVRTGPDHANNFGIVHGGLLCTLLDVAMGTAARQATGYPVMTLDMQISFLAPGRGTLTATGRVVRAGRSIIFTEAEIRAEDQELVAKSTGIFKPVRRKEAEAGAVADPG